MAFYKGLRICDIWYYKNEEASVCQAESVDLTPQSLMTGFLNICRFEEYMHPVIYSI